MRPVRRGVSPQSTDFADFHQARTDLVSNLGFYCSYCERLIEHLPHVEHIQPQSKHPALKGCWENLLLACVNCNATKKDKDVSLAETLWPDRDNTFFCLVYRQDGNIEVRGGVEPSVASMAVGTLKMVGLDKPISNTLDANGKAVYFDRVGQRFQAWGQAKIARDGIVEHPHNEVVMSTVIALARKTGYFSIWMSVFSDDAEVRNRLVNAFPGTRESGCFSDSGESISPAPNPDGLPHGGKA